VSLRTFETISLRFRNRNYLRFRFRLNRITLPAPVPAKSYSFYGSGSGSATLPLSVKEHLETIHEELLPERLMCTECPHTFLTNEELKRHVSQVCWLTTYFCIFVPNPKLLTKDLDPDPETSNWKPRILDPFCKLEILLVREKSSKLNFIWRHKLKWNITVLK